MTTTSQAGISASLTPALMRLLMGFQATQIAASVVRLGIDEALASGPRSLTELTHASGASMDGLGRLLRAAATLALVQEPAPDRFELTELGAQLHAQRDLAKLVGSRGLYLAHSGLSDAVISGRPAAREVLGAPMWEYLRDHPDEQADFDQAMSSATRAYTGAIVHTIELSRFRRIIDVGGGRGTNLAAVLRAAPQASGVLFDQPQVIATAGDLFAAHGLTKRVELVGGSFLESVPAGGDLYILRAVILNWDDDNARLILRTCARAAPQEATLLIVEPTLPPSREPSFLDLIMLVAVGGRQRTVADHQALLDGTGWRFDAAHQAPQSAPGMPPLTLIEARRSA